MDVTKSGVDESMSAKDHDNMLVRTDRA